MTTTLKFNKQYMVVPRGLNMCSRYAVIYGKKEHCLSQVSSKWHFYHTWSFSITSSLLHTSYLSFSVIGPAQNLAVFKKQEQAG